MGDLSGTVLRTLFKHPATVPYIGGNFKLDERYRGLLQYDPTECIACGLCMKDCPTGAIKVVNNGTPPQREMEAYLDMGRCIFCGQCAQSCAKHCISLSSDENLSRFRKEDLLVKL